MQIHAITNKLTKVTFFFPLLIIKKMVQAKRRTIIAKAPVMSPIYAWVLFVGLVAGVTSFRACVVSPLAALILDDVVVSGII